MHCPRCRHEQPEAAECARCGVVFARLREGPVATRPPRTGDTGTKAAPRRGLRILAVAGLAFACGWLVLDREQGGDSRGQEAPPVPAARRVASPAETALPSTSIRGASLRKGEPGDASPTPAAVEDEPSPAAAPGPLAPARVRDAEAEARAARAEEYRRAGRLPEAATELELSLARDPGHDPTVLFLALVQIERGRLPEAKAALRRVGSGGQLEALFHELTGRIAYAEERLEDALAAYRKAAEIDGSRRLDPIIERIAREVSARDGGGRSLESRRFEVFFDGAENIAIGRKVLDALERVYPELARAFDVEDFSVPTILYSGEDYRAVTGAPDWAAALYDGKIRVPIGGLQQVDREFLEVLKHELAHAFIARKGGAAVPRWLHEGLAQHYSGRTSGRFRLTAGDRARAASPVEPLDVSLFYAQALLRVEYLLERFRERKVMAVLEEMRSGLAFEPALERGANVEWRSFLEGFQRRTLEGR